MKFQGWKCSECGHVYDGDQPLAVAPGPKGSARICPVDSHYCYRVDYVVELRNEYACNPLDQ